MLLNKYKVKNIDGFLSNYHNKKIANDWLQNPTKPLFITGPCGSGKTTFAHLLLEKTKIIEIDTYKKINIKMIDEIFNNFINCKSIYYYLENIKTSLIIDEIEIFTNTPSEKNIIKSIINLIKTNNINKPFIIISNNNKLKIIKQLMKLCLVIKIDKPFLKDYINYLTPIINKEKIKYNIIENIKLLNFNFRDIMLSLNDNTQLQKKYNEKDIKNNVNNFLNNKYKKFNYNKQIIFLLHENIIKKKINTNDLIKFNNNLIQSSKFKNKTFNNYNMSKYSYLYSIDLNKKIINNYNNSVTVTYSKLHNKISQANKKKLMYHKIHKN